MPEKDKSIDVAKALEVLAEANDQKVARSVISAELRALAKKI